MVQVSFDFNGSISNIMNPYESVPVTPGHIYDIFGMVY